MMIYIIHKISISLQITCIILKIIVSNAYFRSTIAFYFFFFKANQFSLKNVMMKSSMLEKDKKKQKTT